MKVLSNITDIMTGYRAFSKKFVKTISVMSPGFQIETELTITALEYRYNVKSDSHFNHIYVIKNGKPEEDKKIDINS